MHVYIVVFSVEFGSWSVAFFPLLFPVTKIKGFPLCTTKQETVRKVYEMLVLITERVTCCKNVFFGRNSNFFFPMSCQYWKTKRKGHLKASGHKGKLWNKCGRSTLCLNVFKQSFRCRVCLINLPGHTAKASFKHGILPAL